eukprot:423684_1
MQLLICQLVLRFIISTANYQPWTDYFDHSTYIDANSDYRMYWSVLEDDKIEIGLEVDTLGWVGFGISTNGLMINSDIVMGWINDEGQVLLQNRYTENTRQIPKLMENNNENIELIEGWHNNTKTYLHFTRLIFPCNENSVQIPIGTARVIFAFNDNTPTKQDNNWIIEQHNNQNRGSTSVNLLQGETDQDMDMGNASYFDITLTNYSVPAEHTTYYCQLFKLPMFNATQHIIRIDPLVEAINEGTVHHFSFQLCPTEHVKEEEIGTGEICNDWANMPSNISHCYGGANLFAWAVGGSNYYFPEHVGLPMSGDSDLQFIVYDVHYTNPQLRSDIIDSSGIRIWYTSQLRENNAAMLWPQIASNPKNIFIPPNIESIKYSAHCTSFCTEDYLPNDGVHVFGNMLHSHTTGIALKLRHIRNGVELAYIDQNDHYDFDYQQLWNLKEEIHVLPADELIVECTYSTVEANRSDMVFGGQSTFDEMCLSFIYVYPPPILRRCTAEWLEVDINDFWLTALNNGWAIGNISEEFVDYSTVFLNVTKKGALEYYEQFIHVDGTNHPTLRYQTCSGAVVADSLDAGIVEIPMEFKEHKETDYCLESTSNEWEVWKTVVIALGAVLFVVIVITIIYIMRRNQKLDYVQFK